MVGGSMESSLKQTTIEEGIETKITVNSEGRKTFPIIISFALISNILACLLIWNLLQVSFKSVILTAYISVSIVFDVIITFLMTNQAVITFDNGSLVLTTKHLILSKTITFAANEIKSLNWVPTSQSTVASHIQIKTANQIKTFGPGISQEEAQIVIQRIKDQLRLSSL
jgi:uncharacterized membrane protein